MAEPSISLVQAALRCRCPRCGQGKLFTGVLTLRPACPVCGLNLTQADTGDAGAVGVIIVLGAIIIVLAFWVDFRFSPPLWVHAILWPTVTIPLAILIMRPVKAALVAAQYHTRSSEMDL
ncbi:DUF983 domain-containing protein [Rhodopila globiformis]|uniref:DUF983 domain-containing protein n=1 Tax=Rhodopila globiformis TaxID=1071 RepID=A0A2S6NKL7_RHOGL|nr:DUF983 domain-containing protein [Rhodopila globiformis]PPQ35619.1 hypothetical protein CCS01_07045 [Rhodopila globiformis]